MEEIEPDIYIDGAHNPEGIEAFIRSARSICGKRPAVLLFSVVKDKNFEQMIGMLAASGVFTHYIIVQMQTKGILQVRVSKNCLQSIHQPP